LRLNYSDATTVYCSINLSFTLPADWDVGNWFATAPAWLNGTAEPNPKGYLTSTFGPDTGRMHLGYNLDTGRGYVRGGLQSFYYGHNSSPFPYADALAACEALAAALLLPPGLLHVRTLETGLNVPTPTAPIGFLSDVSRARYARKPFEAIPTPKGCPRPLGYYAPFVEYRVKVYDKGGLSIRQGKPCPAGGHGIRFEMCYEKGRKLATVLGWATPVTLACLMEPAVYSKLTTLLLKAWLTMEFAPSLAEFIRYGIALTPKEADLLAAYASNPQHSQEKERLGIISKKTLDKDLSTLKSLRERLRAAAPAHPYTALVERELAAAAC
jgi:hypothetical protein